MPLNGGTAFKISPFLMIVRLINLRNLFRFSSIHIMHNEKLKCTSFILVFSYKNEPKDICNETSHFFPFVIKQKRAKRVYNKSKFVLK